MLITESQNHLGWERPPRPPSPTDPTLPSPPLNHISKLDICRASKALARQRQPDEAHPAPRVRWGPALPRELSSKTGPEEGLGETSSLCGLLLAFRHLRGHGVTQAGVMRPSKQDARGAGGSPLRPQECGSEGAKYLIARENPPRDGQAGSPWLMDAMGGTWGLLPCRQSTPRSCPCGCLSVHHVGACRRCHIVAVGTWSCHFPLSICGSPLVSWPCLSRYRVGDLTGAVLGCLMRGSCTSAALVCTEALGLEGTSPGRGTQSRLPRTTSHLLFNLAKEGGPIAALVTLTVTQAP